ncbi:transposase [Verrucomicrobiota bacterium]|nr:transposase [Verrucomicrobiota bacterium]
MQQPRSTQRYEPQPNLEERRLIQRLQQLSRAHPRYGYRRITALLRRAGWCVNRKRVQRLWRQEGLKVPPSRHKRRALGVSATDYPRRATRPNEVWSYDFVHDQTADGRPLKWLPVVDEFTRENLALTVERRLNGAAAIRTLAGCVAERGAPAYLRSDNGPEFIAREVQQWLARVGVATIYIPPGCPWENPYSESFNGKLRDEFLNREEFTTVAEAQVLGAQQRQRYNHERPHSSLEYQTPAEFAAACRGRKSFPSPSGEGKGRNNRKKPNTQKLS